MYAGEVARVVGGEVRGGRQIELLSMCGVSPKSEETSVGAAVVMPWRTDRSPQLMSPIAQSRRKASPEMS